MNCKIGDLAVVIGKGPIAGRIVEVFKACPQNVVFCLPDGYPHEPVDYEWIVRLQNPAEVNTTGGMTRRTVWAPAPDRKLRPVSGIPMEDEVTEDLKEPA